MKLQFLPGAAAPNVFTAQSGNVYNVNSSGVIDVPIGPDLVDASRAGFVDPTVTPSTQYTTMSAASGVIPAANFAGADKTTLQQSGATALTTPTAAAILAAIPNGFVGMKYRLRIKNTNGGTLTITADASVTLTGTATIATTVWREYDVTILTATTASMQDVGSGAA